MGGDEEGTLARLKLVRRAVVDFKIEEHRGRIVKTTGDGLLVGVRWTREANEKPVADLAAGSILADWRPRCALGSMPATASGPAPFQPLPLGRLPDAEQRALMGDARPHPPPRS